MTVGLDKHATAAEAGESPQHLAHAQYENLIQIFVFAGMQILKARVVDPWRADNAARMAEAERVNVGHHIEHHAAEIAGRVLTSEPAAIAASSLLSMALVKVLERIASED